MKQALPFCFLGLFGLDLLTIFQVFLWRSHCYEGKNKKLYFHTELRLAFKSIRKNLSISAGMSVPRNFLKGP